ncbi:type II toxin-antitoxin system RelE/ParE family toxin [Leucobacter sp. HY1908]
MNQYCLTPAAQRDLSSIWDFTQERWDASQAEICIFEIREAIERVAANPARGRRVDHIRSDYQRYAAGSHLIFYIEREAAIDVIRTLHQRMDPTRHL